MGTEVLNITFRDGCEYRYPEAVLKSLLGANVQDVLIYRWDDLSDGFYIFARGYEPFQDSGEEAIFEEECENVNGRPCVCKNLGYWQVLTKDDLNQTHGGVLYISYEGRKKLERIGDELVCTTTLYALADIYLSKTENNLYLTINAIASLLKEEMLNALPEKGDENFKDIDEAIAAEMNLPVSLIKQAAMVAASSDTVTIISALGAKAFSDYESAVTYLAQFLTSGTSEKGNQYSSGSEDGEMDDLDDFEIFDEGEWA